MHLKQSFRALSVEYPPNEVSFRAIALRSLHAGISFNSVVVIMPLATANPVFKVEKCNKPSQERRAAFENTQKIWQRLTKYYAINPI